MKKNFTSLVSILALFLLLPLWYSCSDDKDPKDGEEDPEYYEATIEITQSGTPSTTSFSVNFKPNGYTAGYRYAIGTSADLEDFEKGELPGIAYETGNELFSKTFNGLTPDKEYTVFAQAYNEIEEYGTIARLSITTEPSEPAVKVAFTDLDVVKVVVKATPNKLVSEYLIAYVGGSVWDLVVEVYGDGDPITAIEVLYSADMARKFDTSISEFWHINGSPDYTGIFAVVYYDLDGDVVDIDTYEVTSPAKTPGVPTPEAITLAIDEITANSITVTVTPGEDTYGYFCNILTKADYDNIENQGVDIINNNIASPGCKIFYEEATVTFDGLNAGTQYVACAVGFNVNGLEGCGPNIIEHFTTPGTRGAGTAERTPDTFRPYNIFGNQTR